MKYVPTLPDEDAPWIDLQESIASKITEIFKENGWPLNHHDYSVIMDLAIYMTHCHIKVEDPHAKG